MIRLFQRLATVSLAAAAALVLSLGFPPSANAQARGGRRLQNAQRQERAQIRQGVKNGTLTKGQAKRLEKRTDQMQSQIARDRANGKLTPQEARQLKNETKREEKAIRNAEDSHKGTSPPTQQ